MYSKPDAGNYEVPCKEVLMFSREARPCDSNSTSHLYEKSISWLIKALILLSVPLLLSCSTLFSENRLMNSTVKMERGEKTREATPKPGDTKIVNGVEFIYEINPKFGSDPYEPQCMWIRKDQY